MKHAITLTILVVVAVAALIAFASLTREDIHRTARAASEFDADRIPTLSLQQQQRLGNDTDPNYEFSRIRSVDVDRDGSLYVFDGSTVDIRVFGPDGRFVRRMGRRGQGPGEFGNGNGVFRVNVIGDTVWVADWALRRLTLFDRAGRVLAASPIQRVIVATEITGLPVNAQPAALGNGGLFVAIPHPASPPELYKASDTSMQLPFIRFDSYGKVVDTAGWYTIPVHPQYTTIIKVGKSEYALPLPASAAPISVILPDGRFVVDRSLAESATAGTFRITRLSFAGDTAWSRVFVYRPATYPAAMLDSFAARAAGVGQLVVYTASGRVTIRRDAADSASAREQVRRQMRFPQFQPPVAWIMVGRDGSVWLRREDTGGPAFRWLVLNGSGNPVGQVEIPRSGVQVMWIEGLSVVTSELDSLDVPSLVRYRLQPR